jgi:undecaprenyl-diphosphatase
MPPIFFDTEIIHFFNHFAIDHHRFNDFVLMLSDNDLLKGGVLVTICWYIWFEGSVIQIEKNRKGIFTTIIFSFVALFITRITVHLSTFRPRPFLNKSLALFLPENLNIEAFSHESSFPSDHATLFMALSYGIWKTNKKIGIVGLIYTIIFILIPRIYLGLHYPSDILIGSLIGIICVELGFRFNISNKLNQYLFYFAEKKPQYFYPLLFLLSYQIADLFEDTRTLMGYLLHTK